jgi:hypothetical protein
MVARWLEILALITTTGILLMLHISKEVDNETKHELPTW